jgi:hypothetical protein
MMMIELTDSARRCLDNYLAELRTSLRQSPSVDVADVERDVVEHIEHALSGAPVAVDSSELQGVLRRLGSPSRWVAQEESSGFQRVLLALRSGPEDLRLGYLSFGLLFGTLLAGACLNMMSGFMAMLPFVLLGIAASFVFARACLSIAADLSGAEKWLIYPSLVIVYVPVTALVLLWPLPIAIAAEVILADPGGPGDIVAWARQSPMGTITAFTFAILGSLWWSFLGFVAWRWPEVVRDCYAPFANGFHRRPFFLILSTVCLLVFLACLSIAVEAWRGKAPGL